MSRVRVTVDDDDIDAELTRLIDTGDARMGMEAVITSQFAATQAAVHVVTGSLKGSGDIDSDYSRAVWTGSITYGGPSPGFPNHPVKYAWLEFIRGDHHNFRQPAEDLDGRYGQAMMRHLRGGR